MYKLLHVALFFSVLAFQTHASQPVEALDNDMLRMSHFMQQQISALNGAGEDIHAYNRKMKPFAPFLMECNDAMFPKREKDLQKILLGFENLMGQHPLAVEAKNELAQLYKYIKAGENYDNECGMRVSEMLSVVLDSTHTEVRLLGDHKLPELLGEIFFYLKQNTREKGGCFPGYAGRFMMLNGLLVMRNYNQKQELIAIERQHAHKVVTAAENARVTASNIKNISNFALECLSKMGKPVGNQADAAAAKKWATEYVTQQQLKPTPGDASDVAVKATLKWVKDYTMGKIPVAQPPVNKVVPVKIAAAAVAPIKQAPAPIKLAVIPAPVAKVVAAPAKVATPVPVLKAVATPAKVVTPAPAAKVVVAPVKLAAIPTPVAKVVATPAKVATPTPIAKVVVALVKAAIPAPVAKAVAAPVKVATPVVKATAPAPIKLAAIPAVKKPGVK